MRPVTALFCLGLCVSLAGCSTGAIADATPELTAAPAPAVSAPAMPPGRGATAPKPSARAAAAESSGKKEEWRKKGGATREKINGMSWRKYETGRKDMPVEKRADLVNQCVIDTMKEY